MMAAMARGRPRGQRGGGPPPTGAVTVVCRGAVHVLSVHPGEPAPTVCGAIAACEQARPRPTPRAGAATLVLIDSAAGAVVWRGGLEEGRRCDRPLRFGTYRLAAADLVAPANARAVAPGDGEGDDVCRVCRGADDDELIQPCACSGSIRLVHRRCLLQWVVRQGRLACELCQKPFTITRVYDGAAPPRPTTIAAAVAVSHRLMLRYAGGAAAAAAAHVLRCVLALVLWLVILPLCASGIFAFSVGITSGEPVSQFWALTKAPGGPTFTVAAVEAAKGLLVVASSTVLALLHATWMRWCEANWERVPSIAAALHDLSQHRRGADRRGGPADRRPPAAPDGPLASAATAAALAAAAAAAVEGADRRAAAAAAAEQVAPGAAGRLRVIADDTALRVVLGAAGIAPDGEAHARRGQPCRLAPAEPPSAPGLAAAAPLSLVTVEFPCGAALALPCAALAAEEAAAEAGAGAVLLRRDVLPLRVRDGKTPLDPERDDVESLAEMITRRRERGEAVVEPDGTLLIPSAPKPPAAATAARGAPARRDDDRRAGDGLLGFDADDDIDFLELLGVRGQLSTLATFAVSMLCVINHACLVVVTLPMAAGRLLLLLAGAVSGAEEAAPPPASLRGARPSAGPALPQPWWVGVSEAPPAAAVAALGWVFMVLVAAPVAVRALRRAAVYFERHRRARAAVLVRTVLYHARCLACLLKLAAHLGVDTLVLPFICGHILAHVTAPLVISAPVLWDRPAGAGAPGGRAGAPALPHISDAALMLQPSGYGPLAAPLPLGSPLAPELGGAHPSAAAPPGALPGAALPSELLPKPVWAKVPDLALELYEALRPAWLLPPPSAAPDPAAATLAGLIFIFALSLLVTSLMTIVRPRALSNILWMFPVVEWAQPDFSIAAWVCNLGPGGQLRLWVGGALGSAAAAIVFVRTPLRILAALLPSLFPLHLISPVDPVRMATDLVLLNCIVVACERVPDPVTLIYDGSNLFLRWLADQLLLRSFFFGGNTLDGHTAVLALAQREPEGDVVLLPPQLHLRQLTFLLCVSLAGAVATAALVGIPLYIGTTLAGLVVGGVTEVSAVDSLLLGSTVLAATPYLYNLLRDAAQRAVPAGLGPAAEAARGLLQAAAAAQLAPAAAPPAAAGPPTASVPPITSSLSGGTAGVEPSPSSDIYADLPTAQSVVFGATFGHGAGTCESPQVRSADTELLGGEMSRASAFSLSYEAGASGSGARVGTTPVRPHDIWGAAAEKRMQNSSNLSHQDSLRSASQAARKSGGDGPAHRRRPSALERPAGSPLDGTVDSVLQRRQGRAGSRAQPLAVFSRTFSSVSPLPSPAQRQPDDSPSFRRRRAPKPKEKLSLAATARVGGSETVAPELPPGMPRGRRASVLAAGMEFLHLEDVHGAGSPAVPLEHNVWDGPLRRIRGAFGGSMRRRSGAPPAGSERPSPMERPGQKTPPRAETEPEGAFDALSHDNNPTRPYRTPPAQPVTLDDYDMHGATVTSRDFSRRRNRRASVLLRQLGDTGRSPLMFAHTARTPATVQLSETSPAPFAQTERKTVSFNVPHTPLGADAEHEIRSPLSASTAPSRSAHKGGKTSLFCWQSAIECYNASWQSYLGFDLGCPFASEFQRECAQERPQVRYLRISGEAMRNAREEGEPSEFDGIAVFPMVPAGAPPSKQPLALSPVSTSGVARVYELSKMARLAAYKLCSPAGNPRRDPVHWVLEVAQESTEGPWLQIDERDDYSLVPMERKAWTERLEIAPLCAPVLTRYARHTTLPTDYRLAEGWAAGSGVDAAAAGRLALWRLSADFLQGAEHGRHELLPACFGGLEWCETWEGGVLAEYLVISRESSSGVSAAALRRVAPDSWAPVPGCPRLFELPASRGAAWRAAAALVDAAAAQQGGECMLLSPAELASLELEDDPPQVGAACRWGAVIAGAATSLRPRITSGAILLEVAKATVTSTEAARAQLAAAVARGQATEVCVTSPPDERLCMLLAELRRALSAEPGLAAQCDDGQEREPFGSLEEQRRLMRGCQSTQGLNCVPEIVCTEGEYRRALAQLRGMLSVMAALPYADTAPSAQSPSREQQQSAWAPEIPPPCRHGDRAAAAAAGAALVAVLAADALGWALWRRFVLRAERIARRLRRDWTFHYPPPGRTVPNCFSGTEFVNALQQHFRCGPVTALRAFEALRVRGVVYRVERHARSNVAAADSSLWESRTLVLPFFDGSSAEGAAGDWPEGALAAALDVRPAPGAPDGLSCTPLRDPPPPDLRGTEYVHAEAYGYALVSTVVVPMLELQAMLFSSPERVILAFRGTANVANMKLDMRCCSDTGRRIDGHGWTGFGSVRERLREWSTSRSRTLRTTARRCCYCRGKRTKLARPLCGKQGRLTWLCRRVRSLGSTRPRVHAGFMHAWKLLEPAVLHEVRRECPADDPRPLYVTGHSLGGALATLAAFSISWKMYGWAPGNEPLKEVRCYTFGCPMAGNLAFTAIYEQAVPESFMVAVDGDPVPQIPCCLCTCTSYRHAGTYVHLNNIGSGSWAVDPTWLDQGIIPTLMCPKLNSHRMAVIADCLNRCLEHLRPGNWPLNWALGTQHLLPGSEDQSEDPLPDRPQPGCSEYEWPWMPLPMAPFAESYDEQALSSGLADQSPEFAADEDGMQAVPIPVPGGEYSAAETTTVHVQTGSAGLMRSEADTGRVGRAEGSGGLPAPCPPLPPPATDGGPCGASDAAAHCPPPSPA
eukprot:TRINITY_DN2381_c1_g1_i1.p1 TRINITY_DN2381_c1_g1~~TRINITY_DN2381_c1_g1_i1.p1  ORF type:complete len:2758 (+),score=710.66 TRINITY_DN2381_c1_g1_i1:89-8275(+)